MSHAAVILPEAPISRPCTVWLEVWSTSPEMGSVAGTPLFTPRKSARVAFRRSSQNPHLAPAS